MHTHRRHLLQLSLAAGLAPGMLRHARADVSQRFALGIASGHPRVDGMVLWTRLTGADLPERVEVRWEVAEDEAFRQRVASGTETAEAGWAHSVHAEPAGLKPGRWYWYRFEALGQRSPVGRTRTTPAADALEPLRFAIASCQRWDHGFFAAWRHMLAEQLDLVMFLGDYIYEYGAADGRVRAVEGGDTVTLAQYRARYAQYKSDPALQAMHAAVPWLFVWDDHEVENDYAGLRGEKIVQDFPARRTAAYQAYWEHQPLPKAWRPRGVDMRMHGRHRWGRLAIIHALDDRQYRDPQLCTKAGKYGSNMLPLRECPELLDPQRTLLGAAQERWLAEGWDATPGRWNLVAQQTLMARMNWSAQEPTDPVYWTDGWDGYAPARNRLLGVVRERQVPNVVVLGGDVHSHVVADLKADFDDAESPTVASEFCGSSITSWAGKQPPGPVHTTATGRVATRRAASKAQTAAGLAARRGFATPRAALLVATRREGPPSGATRRCIAGPHASAGGALRLDWPLTAGLRDPLPSCEQALDALRAVNPHLHYARNDQRGYMAFVLDAREGLRATVRVLDDALKPDSDIRTTARFAVLPGRPGIVAG